MDKAYAGFARPALLSILALSVLWTVTSVLTAVLFFAKRTSAPRFFVALSWFSVLLSSTVAIGKAVSGFSDTATSASLGGDFARELVATILWTSYMFVSERVKATFVRRHSPPEPAVSAEAPEAAS